MIVNNIASGFGIDWLGLVPSNWSSVTIDHNLHNLSLAHGYGDYAYFLDKTGKGVQCKPLACVQKTWGYEMNSLVAVPMFTAIPNGTLGSGGVYFNPGSYYISTAASSCPWYVDTQGGIIKLAANYSSPTYSSPITLLSPVWFTLAAVIVPSAMMLPAPAGVHEPTWIPPFVPSIKVPTCVTVLLFTKPRPGMTPIHVPRVAFVQR